MSVLCPAPLQNPSAPPTAPPAAVEFQYTQTESFAQLLQELRVSLLVSTYQANKLLVVRANGGGLSTLVRTFERPMGMAVDRRRLTLATRNAIWVMRNAPDLAPRIDPVGEHDACYVPRSCHLTGDIGVHEIAWATPHPQPLPPQEREEELWVVNTRFSCLCTLHPDYSFVPRWQDGRLWLLESGTGQLVLVDPASGRRQRVAELPGFARGLALSGPYAFVGLSKIRKTSAMDGVPLAERREQLKCGVAVVDLGSGQVIAFLEFQTAVEEIFDVQLLPGLHFPEVIGFQKETLHHTFIIPPEQRSLPQP